jgi:hypothetical protein
MFVHLITSFFEFLSLSYTMRPNRGAARDKDMKAGERQEGVDRASQKGLRHIMEFSMEFLSLIS